VTKGTTYNFYYLAKNIYGWSTQSPTVGILAATLPDKIATPVRTSLDVLNIKFEWDAATEHRGDPVTAYIIEFKTKVGTFVTDSRCDGSADPVLTGFTCSIPMLDFSSAPFNFVLNDLIIARVSTTNGQGTSIPTDENTSG
jgi:hypothetical protein